MAYTPDSIWRNRDRFLQGRDEIEEFLADKWSRENGYRLRKELFAFKDNKVGTHLRERVRFGGKRVSKPRCSADTVTSRLLL